MLTATPENLITQLRQYWVMLIVLITLLMLASGIRFSDGSMLLAISSGATIADPVFSNPSTQYVWDAPLKIWLLQLLPSSVIIIAIASAIVAIAPLATTLTRDPLLFWLTLVALFLTPALKISLQNIGVGDGFTVLAIVLAAWTRSHLLIAVMFLMLALWHPQQTFFIGLSFFIGHWLYSHEVDWKMMITVAIVLLLGAILFFVWKDSLAFEYAGREAYMADNLSRFISRNPIAYIISYLPILFWLLILAPRPYRGMSLLIPWLAVLAVVSALTTDVTRVMTIVCLPIVLLGAKKIYLDDSQLSLGPLLGGLALTFALPVYAWSGYDVLLWSDLLKDFCKWGVYCP